MMHDAIQLFCNIFVCLCNLQQKNSVHSLFVCLFVFFFRFYHVYFSLYFGSFSAKMHLRCWKLVVLDPHNNTRHWVCSDVS